MMSHRQLANLFRRIFGLRPQNRVQLIPCKRDQLAQLIVLEERKLYDAAPMVDLAEPVEITHLEEVDWTESDAGMDQLTTLFGQQQDISLAQIEQNLEYLSDLVQNDSGDQSIESEFDAVDWLDLDSIDWLPADTTEVVDDATRIELIVIDRQVEDYETLIADITVSQSSGTLYSFVFLDQQTDAFHVVGEAMDDGVKYDAVHIISHGADGQFQFGKETISHETMHSVRDEWADWAQGLNADADILIYGCDLGRN